MPNKNYKAGRRFEWEMAKIYKAEGWECIRAAGSHGRFDLVLFGPAAPPEFVQCKVVAKRSDADALTKKFKRTTTHNPCYFQTLTVKIKGTKVPQSVTV